MKCPVCKNTLTPTYNDNVEVDVCQGGCGGIWFDRFEIKKMDEKHENVGTLLQSIEKDDSIEVDHSKRRKCPNPKCNVIMMRHFFSVKKEVEVDECPTCAGFWLDLGELLNIRKQFDTEDERKSATSKCFNSLFDADLAKNIKDRKEKSAKAEKIARCLKYICPSYYIKGKQKGGAF